MGLALPTVIAIGVFATVAVALAVRSRAAERV
jgi:hypothetical protein